LRHRIGNLPEPGFARFGCPLFQDLFRDIFHAVDDVDDIAPGIENRRIERLPIPHLEFTLDRTTFGDIVFLDRHGVGPPVAKHRSGDARRSPTPVAVGSAGLSGNASNRLRLMICSRVVMVARRRASLAATIVKSGVRTGLGIGVASNKGWKSSARPSGNSILQSFS